MPFDKPARNRGRYDSTQDLIAAVGFRNMSKGDPVEVGTRSRRAEWWRRGWVVYAKEPKTTKKVQKQEAVATPVQPAELATQVAVEEQPPLVVGNEEAVEEQPPLVVGNEEAEPTPVTAQEGEKGWWTVLYSDETEKKLRRSEVEGLGLI